MMAGRQKETSKVESRLQFKDLLFSISFEQPKIIFQFWIYRRRAKCYHSKIINRCIRSNATTIQRNVFVVFFFFRFLFMPFYYTKGNLYDLRGAHNPYLDKFFCCWCCWFKIEFSRPIEMHTHKTLKARPHVFATDIYVYIEFSAEYLEFFVIFFFLSKSKQQSQNIKWVRKNWVVRPWGV